MDPETMDCHRRYCTVAGVVGMGGPGQTRDQESVRACS